MNNEENSKLIKSILKILLLIFIIIFINFLLKINVVFNKNELLKIDRGLGVIGF